MQAFNSCAPLVVLRVKRHTVGCSKPVAAPSCGYLGDIPIVQEACATLIGDACHSALYCQPPVHSGSGRGSFRGRRNAPSRLGLVQVVTG